MQDYNSFVSEKSSDVQERIGGIKKEISSLEKQIANIANAIATSGSLALVSKLEELESSKRNLTNRLELEKRNIQEINIPDETIRNAFYRAKMLFRSKELSETRELINLFVERVTVYAQHIDVEINVLHLLSLAVTQNNNKSFCDIRQDAFIKKNKISRSDFNKDMRKTLK